MSEKNIFIALSNYTPQSEKNPEENHFTEAFACVLENNKPLLKKLVLHLLKKGGKDTGFVENIKGDELSIETQVSHTLKGRPKVISDMEITAEPLLIVVENKLDSKEGEDYKGCKQLDGYLNLLNSKEGITHKFLFYITLHWDDVKPDTQSSKYFIQARWSEIYTIINDYIRGYIDNSENNWNKKTLEQFIEYMEVEHMAPFNGFSEGITGTGKQYVKFRDQLKLFIGELKDFFMKKGYKAKDTREDYCEAVWFENSDLEKANFYGWGGFYFWTEDRKYPNFPTGTYCSVGFIPEKEDVPLDATKDPMQNMVFVADGKGMDKGVYYDCLLDGVIQGANTPEEQRKKLLNFYETALNELQKSKGYQSLLK